MITTTQTINTSEDFDRWWMETGQFLQPCDVADSEMREQFRLFASKMYGFEDNYYREKFEKVDADLSDAQDELAERDKEIETLEADLNEVLASSDPDAQKLRDITALLK